MHFRNCIKFLDSYITQSNVEQPPESSMVMCSKTRRLNSDNDIYVVKLEFRWCRIEYFFSLKIIFF